MCANDPKQTLGWLNAQNLKRYDALVDLGGRREAARISSLCGWFGRQLTKDEARRIAAMLSLSPPIRAIAAPPTVPVYDL